ncbi:MAG: isocitrate lyase/phosphoenolpyruvate mutase family protein [Pseudomonadota bacterium]
MSRHTLAAALTALHEPGNPVVLYNIWDAGSALAVIHAGANAIATGSASVAAAHGYDDGEQLPLSSLRATIERITATVAVPVSVDMESGYGESAEQVGETAVALAGAGAVGCNFEDQRIGDDSLYTIAEQCQRLIGIRKALADDDLPMHINARTDLFLKQPDDSKHTGLIEAAIDRASAYADAGADSFFVPWLADLRVIEQLCAAVNLPINVMWRDGLPPIKELAEVGVARVSFGPGPYRQAMAELEAAATRLYR